jgi:hypothetical protein
MPIFSNSPNNGVENPNDLRDDLNSPSKDELQQALPSSTVPLPQDIAPQGLSQEELSLALQARPPVSIKEAAQRWVREFNSIPSSLINKLTEVNPDEFAEITPFYEGQTVKIYQENGDYLDEGIIVALKNYECVVAPTHNLQTIAQVDVGYAYSLLVYHASTDPSGNLELLARYSNDESLPTWYTVQDELGEDDSGVEDDQYVEVKGKKFYLSEMIKNHQPNTVVIPEGDLPSRLDTDKEPLPMWGTMWAFDDSLDNEWLRDGEGLEALAKCGFRVYEQEDYDYVFGIDGAGYDFYEEHWIPLYKLRGLEWHDNN